MASPQEFQLFLEGLQDKVQKDQLLIQEIVTDYKTQDWESLYARLCHEHKIQAGCILVESMGLSSEEASQPHFVPKTALLEKYMWRHVASAGPNQWFAELPLPDTEATKLLITNYLFSGKDKIPERLIMQKIEGRGVHLRYDGIECLN
jgi:hypothetical protein